MNSGPGGTWKRGPLDWSSFLPVERVRIYYVDRTWHDGWDDAPLEGVAGVLLLHARGLRTWIAGHDEYCFPGSARTLLGEQVGEVNGPEWEALSAWMRAHGEGC